MHTCLIHISSCYFLFSTLSCLTTTNANHTGCGTCTGRPSPSSRTYQPLSRSCDAWRLPHSVGMGYLHVTAVFKAQRFARADAQLSFQIKVVRCTSSCTFVAAVCDLLPALNCRLTSVDNQACGCPSRNPSSMRVCFSTIAPCVSCVSSCCSVQIKCGRWLEIGTWLFFSPSTTASPHSS